MLKRFLIYAIKWLLWPLWAVVQESDDLPSFGDRAALIVWGSASIDGGIWVLFLIYILLPFDKFLDIPLLTSIGLVVHLCGGLIVDLLLKKESGQARSGLF